MELTIGETYAVNTVDDTKVYMYKLENIERGFYVFRDKEGNSVALRPSSCVVRKIYPPTEAKGRCHGESIVYGKPH